MRLSFLYLCWPVCCLGRPVCCLAWPFWCLLRDCTLLVLPGILVTILNNTQLKGTVRLISSDPPCKDGNAWYTTVPLKPFLINNVEDLKVFISDDFYMFSCCRNAQLTFVEKPQPLKICFHNYKHWYLIRSWSNKAFNGTTLCIRHCHLSIDGHLKLRLQSL